MRHLLLAAAAGFVISTSVALAHGEPRHAGAAHGGTATDGQPGNPAEATRTVRVETREHEFNVKQVQVKAGETIRFLVTNVSYEPHEFGIASPKEHEEHRAMM